MHALVVSPDRVMRDTLDLVVSAFADCHVDTVPDGPAAISLMAQDCPDLILLDGRLPRAEVFSIIAARARLAPMSRIAVLMDPAGTDQELAATGAEVLPVYTRPAAELYDALARLACGGTDVAYS